MARETPPISIPEPVANIDSLWRTAQVLKEAVEVLQGIRGNRAAITQEAFDRALSDLDAAISSVTTGGGGGATTLTQLNDVVDIFVGLADGQVLTYDTVNGWQNEVNETNATHTGEVTGSVGLTVDVSSITNKVDLGVECDPLDDVAIHDDSIGDLKKVNVSVITDGGYF